MSKRSGREVTNPLALGGAASPDLIHCTALGRFVCPPAQLARPVPHVLAGNVISADFDYENGGQRDRHPPCPTSGSCRPATITILPTRNEAWGFFGTMQAAGADPMQAWNAASAMIAAATDASPEGVRDFLDSRYGRHFADDVVDRIGGRAAWASKRRSKPRSPAGWAGGSTAEPTAKKAFPPGFPT